MNWIASRLDLYRLVVYSIMVLSHAAWAKRARTIPGRWYMASAGGYFVCIAGATVVRHLGQSTDSWLTALSIPLTGMLVCSLWALWGR